ncbi:hypothetical protein MARA_01150 (plasmid) [Mycolicibacterium arabiense]|uniref:N-acetyltransferase domain-containing protein n=1 Tax=Mycolicibacterium arabiense TaxID=1286181 RepID=A0A7I7RS92_9MYCO|nr:GNAT family N-acetyltransferase [Mycolicibacterium arabiense]MCV7371994.1 GNAT family N-acetyltransferase [Mycolicibacterium arabiense]BBY46685.1 hypothetical protein MARA_01150 [Mycolicibacterium arabiense]
MLTGLISSSNDGELGAQLEGVEAEVMYRYEALASPTTQSHMGIATARIGGGVALSVRNDVTGYWSKALGFGFTEPVTGDLIQDLVDFYRTERSQGSIIQIAPSVLPDDWPEIAEHHGLRVVSEWVKLAGPIADMAPGRTDLRVAPVERKNVRDWAATTLRGFDMPTTGLVDMLSASVVDPNIRPFAAWDGDEMVAVANLFTWGEMAAFSASATRPSHRRRGAQSALIAAAAAEASRSGCQWMVAETGQPGAGEVNPSLNNLMRSGLEACYTRQNWKWTPEREGEITAPRAGAQRTGFGGLS